MPDVGLTKVELNGPGVRDLLRGAGHGSTLRVQADLMRRGQAIARAAGEGHRVRLNVESHRASVIVITVSPRAMMAEAVHRNLTRALDAGR